MTTPRRDRPRPSDSRPHRRAFLRTSVAEAAGAALLTQAGRAWPAPASRRAIRMAVVGGGFGSQFYWHEHPDCVVAAVTDLRADRRQRLQQVYRCPNAYPSLEVMIRRARDVDAVAVFSGAPDHARHVRMCLERGWHVISAVPACMTLDEAGMLHELKRRTGLRYMMAETSWYRQEVIFARNLYRAGGFGELFYTEAEYYHDRGDLKRLVEDKTTRFYEPDGRRSWRWGLAPMNYPTHSLGFLTGVTGERIVKVSCLGWAGNRPDLKNHPYVADNVYRNPFWNSASMMLTDRNHMCRCNVFWLCAAHGERAQWFGDRATFYMPKGGLHEAIRVERLGGRQEALVPRYWESDMLPEPMRHNSGHGGSHTFLTAEFVNALLEDREPEINLSCALAMTVPGIVARQSAMKEGEQLEVPQFESNA